MKKTDSNDTQLDIIDIIIDRKPAGVLWIIFYSLFICAMVSKNNFHTSKKIFFSPATDQYFQYF